MSHRNLLARATEGTDAPTPGYVYVDLTKVCTSNPGVCQEVSLYLIKRLQKHNPNIKWKACKVISKLCDSVPRNAFRRCVAQDHIAIECIKEALAYKGTPDPVRGDTVNQTVRDSAREALEAVYREAPSSESAAQHNIHTSSSGYGPSPVAPPSSSNSSSGRMQGIGNPMFADPRLDPRYSGEHVTNFQSVVSEAKEVIVGMIKDPLARNVHIPEPPRHSGSYGGPTYGRPPPGSSELARRTGGEWTMASNRGPGAHDYTRGTVGGSWGSATTTPSIRINHNNPTTTTPSNTGTAVSDGTYEKNLVLELCPPGGLKAVPPPDKLAQFARTCVSLNSDLVCPVLLDLIEDGQPWIIRAKALCVMETAIANGSSSGGHNLYRDFFYACAGEIQPLASHPRAPIHEPAQRVLALLGVEATSTNNNIHAATTTAPVAAAPNLLDFDDDPPAPAPTPPTPATSSSMFGGMQVKQAAPPAAAPPVAAPPAPLVPTPPAPSLLDFATETTPPPATPAVNSAKSLFGDLTVPSEPAEAPAASGFGFINSEAPSAVADAPATFDPLKQLHPHSSPSATQKLPMVMSPEQLQAMAYQQMMMQQQFQQMQYRPHVVPVFPNMVRPSPNYSFQAKPAKKDDKKFDFVMDAMKTAGHKK